MPQAPASVGRRASWKAWFDGQRRWWAARLLPVALCVLFGFVVIKAASTDMTFDEAWTFLLYGRSPLGFTALDLANDHPLNSILIFLATRLFGDSELVVRLPNILAGGLYLASSATIIRRSRFKLVSFAICALQPFFLDYFSLARGYGIAVALVQYGLAQHFTIGQGTRRLPMLLGATLLASLSIFSTVVVLYALIAAHALTGLWGWRRAGAPLSKMLRQDFQRNGSIVFLVLGLAPIAGLIWVSRHGLPLYGSQTGFFDSMALSFARMYVPADWAFAAAVSGIVLVVVMLVASVRTLRAQTATLLLTIVLALVAVFLSARLLGRPLPTGRVLLPWVPIWNLGLIGLLEDVAAAWPRARPAWLMLPSVILAGAIALAFSTRLHFSSANDWGSYAALQPRLVQALVNRKCLPPDVAGDYGQLYYIHRWFPPGQPPAEPPCPAGQ